MTETSGTDRILARLRAGHDVTPIDFDLPGVVDGGKPIQRVAARILDLKRQGHEIARVGTRNKCAVYRLIRDANAPRITEDIDGQMRLDEAA